ncbi:MAG: hypothetical protein LBQ93_10870 [Treponema sp.]|jgi:hypothetical protein|nr:hypothetical protein [Treponema sp.]
MKKLLRFFGIIALATVIVFTVASCSDGAEPTTYTVWTDSSSYNDFYTEFQTSLNDGYYLHYEFTSSEWSTISPLLTNEGKHNWTESEIKNWFIGRGFGNSEANQETAWLMTINHGFIASRSGSIVYMLLK